MRYFLRRLGSVVPVAIGVATLTFAMLHLVPGDPVIAMLGETAAPGDIAGLRHSLGLDRPLGEQYLDFLGGLSRGHLGDSITYHRSVARLIAERFPATLELTIAGLLVGIVIAFPLGVISGAKPGSVADLGAMGFAILGISIPHIYLGPLLMIIFSLDLRWFPLTGRGGFAHLVLPAITLGGSLAAILTRMVRTAMLEELGQDYIRTARAKGLSENVVVYKHALRNALVPVLTVVGLQFGALLAGAIVTETIFSWPGIGRLTISAISTRDYYLVQGCILTIGLTYVVVNFLTDFLYSLANPRIRQ